MASKIHLTQLAIAATFWASAATSHAADGFTVQAFNRCPTQLTGLQALVDRLEVESKTPEDPIYGGKTRYKPAGLSVFGNKPVNFVADVRQGKVAGVNVALPGSFKQYAAALQQHQPGTECEAERCRWMRTDTVPSGTLIYVYLAQDSADGGKNATLSCSYFR